MEDAPCDGADGAQGWVATAAQSDDFTANAILLVREGESGKGCGVSRFVTAGDKMEASVADEELDVLEAEGRGIGWAGSVFARPEEEEKGDGDHVCDRHEVWKVGGIGHR